MRHILASVTLTVLFSCLLGCSETKVFNNIRDVQVRQIGAEGLSELEFDKDAMNKLITCLNTKTELIEKDEGKQLLQATYLLQIKDSYGERSFELYTEQNLKGNKGNYYRNKCVYGLVR